MSRRFYPRQVNGTGLCRKKGSSNNAICSSGPSPTSRKFFAMPCAACTQTNSVVGNPPLFVALRIPAAKSQGSCLSF